METLRDKTFDRLKKSIAGQKSDGHGVFLYYTYPFFQSISGVRLDDYFHSPKVMFDTQLEVLEKLDKCGSFAPDAGAVAECSALGGAVRFDDHGFISVKEAPVNDLDDILRIKPGDPYGDNYMRRALETLEYMLAHAPKDIKVNPPALMGPFTIAAQLRGISEFCMDLLTEEEMCEALLDVCTQTAIDYMKAAEKLMGGKLHHILVCDDLSAFVSRPCYIQWVLPVYQKLFDAFPGTQMWLHNDAQAEHIAAEVAAAGWDAWQYAPHIPPLKALADTGGKVTLMGGLDPVELQGLDEQQTYDLCIKTLKGFEGNTRLALGPGGSANQIPIENLKAIFRAAAEFKIQ